MFHGYFFYLALFFGLYGGASAAVNFRESNAISTRKEFEEYKKKAEETIKSWSAWIFRCVIGSVIFIAMELLLHNGILPKPPSYAVRSFVNLFASVLPISFLFFAPHGFVLIYLLKNEVEKLKDTWETPSGERRC